MFNRKHLLKRFIFHCYVSLPGRTIFATLQPKLDLRTGLPCNKEVNYVEKSSPPVAIRKGPNTLGKLTPEGQKRPTYDHKIRDVFSVLKTKTRNINL